MIRLYKHKNHEYLLVDTDLTLVSKNVKVKIHVTADVTNINEKDQLTIYKHVNSIFNKQFIVTPKVTPPPTTNSKKAWYKFW